jgi:hypothetical protein
MSPFQRQGIIAPYYSSAKMTPCTTRQRTNKKQACNHQDNKDYRPASHRTTGIQKLINLEFYRILLIRIAKSNFQEIGPFACTREGYRILQTRILASVYSFSENIVNSQ